MSDILLSEEQREAVTNRGGALLVSAAAGSGKTRVLVERLIRRVTDPEQNCDIDEFLVITFTKAAAAELRGRILDVLTEKLRGDPSNRRLRRQLNLCRHAMIGTIHSFCVSLLREYAHLIMLPPDFRVMDQQESDFLRERVAQRLLDQQYEHIQEDADFAALVDCVSTGGGDAKLASVLLETHAKLRSHPEPEKWAEEKLQELELGDVTDVAQTIWGERVLAGTLSKARFWRNRLAALLDTAAGEPAFQKGYGESLAVSLAGADGLISALETGWDAAASFPSVPFPRGKAVRGSDYELLKAERDRCKKAFGKLTAPLAAPSSVLLTDMRLAVPMIRGLMELVLRFDDAYTAEKRRRGVLDFADQEHLALRLLTDPATGAPSDAAAAVSARYTEIMVDEFQDINAVQERIFQAVSRNGRNLFLVGDVKQSIYRFRLADPTIFLSLYATYPHASDANAGEGRKVLLSTNYRSGAGVLSAVNYVFRALMSESLGEMAYTPREYLRCGGGQGFCGTGMELDVVDSAGANGFSAEPDYAARRIQELLDSGTVSDGTGGVRRVRPGDIAILMRSPSTRTARYAAALEARGIPCSAAKTESFFASEEISIAVSLLSVVDNPCQDLPLLAVMTSPLYGFTADDLTGVRLSDREGDLWSAVNACAKRDERCRRFLEELNGFRAMTPDLTADELLWHIYSVTALPAVMGAMPGGTLRQRNLMLLYEMAQSFTHTGYGGLCRFVEYLREMITHGKEPEEAALTPTVDAVRILSIHKAKGLEYPIVFLCDSSHKFNMDDLRRPMLIHPELGAGPMLTDVVRRIQRTTLARMAVERALRRELLSEELRVLYVGMTRAREKLIVTILRHDAQKDLSKLASSAAFPVPPELLEDSGSVGDWLLLAAMCRPESGVLRGDTPVPLAEDDGMPWTVQWIQPEEVSVSQPPSTDEDARSADPGLVEELRKRLAFVYPHEAAVNLPSKLTATELKGRDTDFEAAEDAASALEREYRYEARRPDFMPERPLTAAQKGTALHLAMQFCDYAKCVTVEGARAEVERLHGLGVLTDREAEAVLYTRMTAFFLSPLGQRVLTADRVYRELKFSLLVPAERFYPGAGSEELLLQGVVDLCFEEAGQLTIVDFKTDHVTSADVTQRARHYEGQLSAYAEAMSRMTHLPVRQRLVYFFSAGIAVEA